MNSECRKQLSIEVHHRQYEAFRRKGNGQSRERRVQIANVEIEDKGPYKRSLHSLYRPKRAREEGYTVWREAEIAGRCRGRQPLHDKRF